MAGLPRRGVALTLMAALVAVACAPPAQVSPAPSANQAAQASVYARATPGSPQTANSDGELCPW